MEFDKNKYWQNRKDGKRGQGESPSPVVKITPSPATIGFNNDGQMISMNREYRRSGIGMPGIAKQTKTKRKLAESRKRKAKTARIAARQARKLREVVHG